MPSQPDQHPPHERVPRVLFGCAGWPSGIMELASWAKRRRLARVVVCQLDPDDAGCLAAGSRFIQRLIEFDPHVVGFRVEGGHFDEVKEYIRAVRRFSNAQIVLGGPTPTSHPKEVLEASRADYVFAGEAEAPLALFLELAQRHNSKDLQAEIPGLAFRHAGRVYHNTLPADGYERTVLDVASKLDGARLRELRNTLRPEASAELIGANRLDWSVLKGFEREFDSLFFTAGRGCPGECTFCAKLHGRHVRVKTAGQLLEEIEAADAKVAEGAIRVTRWKLFEHVDDPALAELQVAWAAVYDEDFFLGRRRAIEFLELWDRSPLKRRYRLGFQTNPCSLLTPQGDVQAELLQWIDRLKPMIQVGAESFNPTLLARWRKRHDLGQLTTVLDALEGTRQDYTVFHLLSDFETTPDELVETLRLLVLSALRRRRMRIASSPFTIPLFDSETRKLLEYGGLLTPGMVDRFADYERPRPDWMDPLAAELADLADSELRWTLNLQQRESALVQAFEVVLTRIKQEGVNARHLLDQANRAMDQIKDARFQGISHPPFRPG